MPKAQVKLPARPSGISLRDVSRISSLSPEEFSVAIAALRLPGRKSAQIIEVLLRRKVGRPGRPNSPHLEQRARGRPRIWGEARYRFIVAAVEGGKKLLAAKGERITDKRAIEEFCIKALPKWQRYRALNLARTHYKRLGDARNFFRKMGAN